jgi:hypothetical protein
MQTGNALKHRILLYCAVGFIYTYLIRVHFSKKSVSFWSAFVFTLVSLSPHMLISPHLHLINSSFLYCTSPSLRCCGGHSPTHSTCTAMKTISITSTTQHTAHSIYRLIAQEAQKQLYGFLFAFHTYFLSWYYFFHSLLSLCNPLCLYLNTTLTLP